MKWPQCGMDGWMEGGREGGRDAEFSPEIKSRTAFLHASGVLTNLMHSLCLNSIK